MASAIKGTVRVQEPDRLERTLARRSAEARATIPDFELTAEVDMTEALSLDCTVTAALVRACALALRETPRANGSYRDGRFELYSRINVGISEPGAETTAIPTVLDADAKSLSELDEEIARLRERARRGELSAPELAGATFTLTDTFGPGIASATPLLIPPQAAAIAAGAVREAPSVRDGSVTSAPMLLLTLACDYRILHGVHAASFLGGVRDRLQRGSGALALKD